MDRLQGETFAVSHGLFRNTRGLRSRLLQGPKIAQNYPKTPEFASKISGSSAIQSCQIIRKPEVQTQLLATQPRLQPSSIVEFLI